MLTFIKTQFDRFVRWLFASWDTNAVTGEAIICMIDIANYSSWCKRFRSSPEHIYRMMFEYNENICMYLHKYNKLRKIELVGDSMVVIGTINDTPSHSQNVYLQMLAFSSDVLAYVPRMKADFDDESISLRIGMHVGYIHGGYIRHPRRFQIFGNPINVASRLQSRTEDGSVLITNKSADRASMQRHSSHSSTEGDTARPSVGGDMDEWFPMFGHDALFSSEEAENIRTSEDFHKVARMKRILVGCESFKGVGNYMVSRLC